MKKCTSERFVVWINKVKRVVSFSQIKGYEALEFNDKCIGLSHIQKLVEKGYKIG